MLKNLCEQFLFSNPTTFLSRTSIPNSVGTVVEYINTDNKMVIRMVFTGVILTKTFHLSDLIPVLNLVTEVTLYKKATVNG